MKPVVIFDFDGTIADTLPAVTDILYALSTKYGFKNPTGEEVKKLKDHSIQEVFKIMHVPFYKLPAMVLDVKKELNKQISFLKPITGIVEVLGNMKREGYILALITSNNKSVVKEFLKNNQLDLFEYIYTGTTLFGKARVINGFLRTYHIAKKHIIYIGDEIRDIEASKKVGIPIITGTWGFNSRKGLEKLYPEFLIDTPSEILPILERI